jgi:hypothetical protein
MDSRPWQPHHGGRHQSMAPVVPTSGVACAPLHHLIVYRSEASYDLMHKRGEVPVTREQRKLAAILAADVVGYYRLMGRDESGTLARLRKNRSEHLDPVLIKYRR